MPIYNFFFIDPRGAVLRRHALDADTDGEGMSIVNRHDDGHDIDIWNGERLVAIFRSATKRPLS